VSQRLLKHCFIDALVPIGGLVHVLGILRHRPCQFFGWQKTVSVRALGGKWSMQRRAALHIVGAQMHRAVLRCVVAGGE